MAQIDSKGYAIPYEADGRKMPKCGVSISSEARNIIQWRNRILPKPITALPSLCYIATAMLYKAKRASPIKERLSNLFER